MQEYSYSYTKHIYAGTQRIASKVGDIEAFGADPRRVEYAGANLKEVDFGSKYKQQTKALLARYDSLGVEHRPNTLNDYVGGQSFCCGEKELVSNNQTGDNTFETPDYEHLIFFYHPDHLGSTALVTDNDGNVVQSVAYIPYGEVFIEERNGTWNTPYLFNGKELDEETGLYYYGARYLNPTSGMWLSTDPLFEKYVGMSPYNYCAGNPVMLVDPDGRRPVYDEDGNLIGTDENGLQGNPVVMSKEHFKQGMSTADADSHDLGLAFLDKKVGNIGNDGKDPYDRFLESYTNLSNRPDWDGVVTDMEARDWWENGNGGDLYIDISKLDLSPLSTNDFKEDDGNKLQYNFFTSVGSTETTSRVHGTLTMRLKNRETGEVGLFLDNKGYFDTYDFNSDGRLVRDITTWVARKFFVGEGKSFGFRPYGGNPHVKVEQR